MGGLFNSQVAAKGQSNGVESRNSNKDALETGNNGNRLSEAHPNIKQTNEENGCAKVLPTIMRYNFRYVIGLIAVLMFIFQSYSSYVLSISLVKMISSDVIASGLIELRSKYLSIDTILPINSYKAIGGSCPVESTVKPSPVSLILNLTENANFTTGLQNGQAFALEAFALVADVNSRVNAKELVDWTANQRGLVLTIHQAVGVLAVIPVSRIATAYGTNHVIIICSAIGWSVRDLLLPVVFTQTPFWFVIVFEIITGSVSQVGQGLAGIISTQIFANGLSWSWCFYSSGILNSSMLLMWLYFGSGSPSSNRFVSQQELTSLQTSSLVSRSHRESEEQELQPLLKACSCTDSLEASECPARKVERKLNWISLIRCPIIWSYICVKSALYWDKRISTLWPTFFANITHLSTSSIGMLALIQGVASALIFILFAIVIRRTAINRPFNVNPTTFRKATQILATVIVTISMSLLITFDCYLPVVVLSYLLVPLIQNLNLISFSQLPLELSPTDSGIIFSLSNFLSISQYVALPISTYVLSTSPTNPATGDRGTWQIVWSLSMVVNILACCIFVVFGKAAPKSYSRLQASGPCKSNQRYYLF